MLTNSQAQLKNNDAVRWFYLITFCFIILTAYTFTQSVPYLLLLPIGLVVVLIAVFHLDLLVFFAVLTTPLSITLAKTSLGIGVSIPAEPLMFGLFIVFWLKVFADGGLDKNIIKHPVTIALFFYLGWMTLTTISSSMFIVSLKSTLAKYCYISVFYFMALHIFRKYENIPRFIWYYVATLLIVIAYTMYNHTIGGFSEKIAHVAMVPFYNDHTAYAAAIAFFIPPLFAFLLEKHRSSNNRSVIFFVLCMLITAIILSYTRASWVGMVGALGVWFLFVFRIQRALILGGFVMLIMLAFLWRTEITIHLANNTKTSSTKFADHVQSISNIKSDASNVERLNRWASAIRMFKDRPILGFGPGTYMFQYGRYQKSSEKSVISTNAATGGGSHSEYLGPLSEQGMFGPVFFIAIIVTVCLTASRVIKLTKSKQVKALTKGLLIGLVTYWIQGSLNYFLDTEKAAVPYWGFIAAIVAMDLYHRNKDDVVIDE